jgi:mono/diheme cytochrome c family protein
VNVPSRSSLFAFLLLAVFASGAVLVSLSQTSTQTARGNAVPTNSNLVERGKYIVNGVAVCSQCHTPRNSAGEYDRSHWLLGAPVWLRSAEPVENWPLQAPRIGGTPPGTDEEMAKLLTTGIWRDGHYLRPPMPQFRMSQQDAEAVVAYLKSLNPERP